MNVVPSFPVLAIAALFLAGCAAQGPYLSQDSTKYTLENTEKFALLDEASRHHLGCTGLFERLLPDTRLEVAVNLKNREITPFSVQVRCVFKDREGLETGDSTAWQTLNLAANFTESIRFTAKKTSSRSYSIEVRQAR